MRERIQISASGHADADQLGTDFFRFRWMSDPIGTEWNGIGNGSQFFIRPINKGHRKYLAAQITCHKSKSKSVNVVFRCTNTLNFQFKCCRPADKVFLLIINLIFLINVSCVNQNLTSQFRTFVCISYDRVWPEKIKFVYQNGHEKKQQALHLMQCTLQVYDLKMIILKWLGPMLTGTQNAWL